MPRNYNLPREPDRIYPDLGYAEIGLTKGYYTKVSLCDYEYLKKYKWIAHAGAQIRVVKHYGRKTHYMHHVVTRLMGLVVGPDMERDHINQDTLDNRRENLRVVTHHENMQNTQRHREKIGYVYHSTQKLWRAYVNYPDNEVISLGYRKTKEEAAELAKLGQELQRNCVDSASFKTEWAKIAPGKKASV